MNGTTPWRLGPIARTSLGLVALLVSLLLLADMLLGLVPSQADQQRALRQRVVENLALQITALLEAGDSRTLGKTLHEVLARDPQIRSITVRRSDGFALLHQGAAPADATTSSMASMASMASTVNHLRVPILAGPQRWGEIDVGFAPAGPATLLAWLQQPFVLMLLVMGPGGFALSYLYLRRAMQYLNPSNSVPDRVRKALDVMSEGLLILDLQTRIVLANKAFRLLHPAAAAELTGRRVDHLDWLLAGWRQQGAAPWAQTLANGAAVSALPLTLQLPDGAALQLVVSTAPITDPRGRARGCLVTFDNVTAIHHANEELRQTLGQLELSRQQVEQQNEDLRRLASRDSLTGCFNRRAFFETAGPLFAQARRNRTALCCLMIDIDHFKRFNDQHGHAVGDQVIQVVARALAAGLRPTDVLARYGGEEFCVVLPGASAVDALAIAQRLRLDIETRAHRAIRGTKVGTITASFGLAQVAAGATSLDALIDQADQALYLSKQAGRNRVTSWQAPAEAAARHDADSDALSDSLSDA